MMDIKGAAKHRKRMHAAGNPCKVIRSITDEDQKYYFKDRQIDSKTYELIFNSK